MSKHKDHWETIYKTKAHKNVGWYQESPDTSPNLLSKIHYQSEQSIIDIGCGSSLLATRSPYMKSHEERIKAADISVFKAKRAGKNCVKAVNSYNF